MVPAYLIGPLTKVAQSMTLALNSSMRLCTKHGLCLDCTEDLAQGSTALSLQGEPCSGPSLLNHSPQGKESLGRGLGPEGCAVIMSFILKTEWVTDTCWFIKEKDHLFSWIDIYMHFRIFCGPEYKLFFDFRVCTFLAHLLYLLWKCYSAMSNSHRCFTQAVTFSPVFINLYPPSHTMLK